MKDSNLTEMRKTDGNISQFQLRPFTAEKQNMFSCFAKLPTLSQVFIFLPVDNKFVYLDKIQ